MSGSSRKPQEASGRHNIKIIINKQTKYSGSEATSSLEISTFKKHCQLITSLIKGCYKALLISDKTLLTLGALVQPGTLVPGSSVANTLSSWGNFQPA